ncbi:MAG: ABC transporter substrate-binding protein [Spirochaetaceae bacterium]|jgi:ABC-type nitrate/sulfonate/bicarbonate transport system substrate-binding protein|nr:ABC transporter substrate-binding protein [Spirochaetaceae bacterium]
MKPIKLITALTLAASIFLPCGCGNAGNNGGENAPGPERIRFILDWSPNTNHTGLYAARDRGWFTEENLTVEILSPPEDGALLLLGSGRAEFAVDVQEGLGPAIGREDPLPVQAVAAVISHNTSGLMSLKSTGIRRPRDLAGKRFASWGTPLVTAVIRDIVEGDGGDFAAVKMIPNNAVDAFSALETDVDSIWIYYAWDGIAAEIRGTETDFLDLGKINPELDFYTPVIVVNTGWAAAHPETVKRFLKALTRGYEFATANPGEAADILLKYAPELDAALVRRSQDYLASRYRGDAKRWGEIDEKRWGAFYQWMYRRGLLDKDIGSGGFTNEYLP